MKISIDMLSGTTKTYDIVGFSSAEFKEYLNTTDAPYIEFRTVDGRDVTIDRSKIDITEVLNKN